MPVCRFVFISTIPRRREYQPVRDLGSTREPEHAEQRVGATEERGVE
jgi:hypothetical protein